MARRYGIDVARSSVLPWCHCGWRTLVSDVTTAREVLAEHQSEHHKISPSEVLNPKRHGVKP